MTETTTVAPRLPISRVMFAGALVAVLDGAFAVVLYVTVLRVCSAAQLMQSIAGALLGRAAFRGGSTTVALGVALHFAVAYGWTLVYAALRTLRSRRLAGDGLAGGAAHSRESNPVLVRSLPNPARLARGWRWHSHRFDRAGTVSTRFCACGACVTAGSRA